MKSPDHTTRKEVSCKALMPLLIAVEERNIDYANVLRGIPYALSYLQSPHERIEWQTYGRIVENLRPFFSPSDFEAMGVKQIKEKRFAEIVVAGFFLFSTGRLSRMLANQAFRVGRQLFNCVDYGTEYLASNKIRITLTMSPGYEPVPEFFLITKGSWYQVGLIVRKGFKLDLVWADRGAFFDMTWEKEGILFKIKRRVRWLFYVRKALTDLDAANVALLKQYDDLVQSKKRLEQQSTLLKTAHEITKSIRQSLEINSTLEEITSALVREAKFCSAALTLFKDVEGNELHVEIISGNEKHGVGRVSRPIHVDGETIGELRISPGNEISSMELDELLGYLVPVISVSIHDALVLRAITDYRNNLEGKVDQRTSELKNTELELSNTISLLRAAREAQNHFFTNISHEFRTPLTLIEGPVQLLRSGSYKGDPEEQYGVILRNSQHMLHLVNQLLDLGKIESGETKRHIKEQDLVEVVKWIAAAFESTAKQKGVTFALRGVDERIVGWFDRDAVEKILSNLLSNAFKFTAKGGKVSIDLRHYVSELQHDAGICVTDTGVGIPPEDIDRVFDRFYQVESAHNHEYNGTGIGLALTKELAELNHGGIHVTSKLGEGSIFSVWFPIGKDHFRPDEIAADTVETATTSRPNRSIVPEVITTAEPTACSCDMSLPLLLIVEDNRDMRKYMRTTVDSSFRVFESANGEEGLQRAVEIIPDIIVSDVMMPKMDGLNLCARLKADERTSHIPVILLTAKAEQDQKIEGLETGADDYMIKPFDPKELLARVRNLIDQRRRLRERFTREIKLKPADIAITSVDERFLNKGLHVVESHISDCTFTAERFAEEMYLSQMQLHRKIKALTNCSPWEFVRTIRLERASQLLQKKAGTVAEIAYEVGYSDPSHFADAFKKQFGVSPSEFAQIPSPPPQK